jgi:hypothetical protein
MVYEMSIWNRIYEDYLMPSRLLEYERLLKVSIDLGFKHQTLSEYFNLVQFGDKPDGYFIHRHDIDSDCRTARKMWEIEQKLGVKTSFYFRLNTLDFGLMKEIHASGSEVGYHYEELAQYAKDHHIKSTKEIEHQIGLIREKFKFNFNRFQDGCGFKVDSVASHGDFVNRKLGMPNHVLVDETLLKTCGIRFECYDKRIIGSFDSIMSDTVYPLFYKPSNPFDELQKKHKTLYLLTHPRHWRSAPIANTRENFIRVWEGLTY